MLQKQKLRFMLAETKVVHCKRNGRQDNGIRMHCRWPENEFDFLYKSRNEASHHALKIPKNINFTKQPHLMGEKHKFRHLKFLDNSSCFNVN